MGLYALVLFLTMLKDWWLTAEEPNALFYIFVPFLTIVGGVLGMYVVGKIGKQTITICTLLAIGVCVNTIMQVVENLMKIIYYRIWAYPGMLYFLIVIPLGIVLVAVGLIRWGKITGWKAFILTAAYFIGSTLVGILLTDVIGITTPGS